MATQSVQSAAVRLRNLILNYSLIFCHDFSINLFAQTFYKLQFLLFMREITIAIQKSMVFTCYFLLHYLFIL